MAVLIFPPVLECDVTEWPGLLIQSGVQGEFPKIRTEDSHILNVKVVSKGTVEVPVAPEAKTFNGHSVVVIRPQVFHPAAPTPQVLFLPFYECRRCNG